MRVAVSCRAAGGSAERPCGRVSCRWRWAVRTRITRGLSREPDVAAGSRAWLLRPVCGLAMETAAARDRRGARQTRPWRGRDALSERAAAPGRRGLPPVRVCPRPGPPARSRSRRLRVRATAASAHRCRARIRERVCRVVPAKAPRRDPAPGPRAVCRVSVVCLSPVRPARATALRRVAAPRPVNGRAPVRAAPRLGPFQISRRRGKSAACRHVRSARRASFRVSRAAKPAAEPAAQPSAPASRPTAFPEPAPCVSPPTPPSSPAHRAPILIHARARAARDVASRPPISVAEHIRCTLLRPPSRPEHRHVSTGRSRTTPPPPRRNSPRPRCSTAC